VDRTGDDALAGAALAGHQHRTVGDGDTGDQAFDLGHFRRVEVEHALLAADQAPQRAVLGLEAAQRVDVAEAVQLVAGAKGARVLVLAGKPIGEPVVQYGPFVMNTREEIEQAIADYQAGVLSREQVQRIKVAAPA
jgi:hypothetical protein